MEYSDVVPSVGSQMNKTSMHCKSWGKLESVLYHYQENLISLPLGNEAKLFVTSVGEQHSLQIC